MSKEAKELIGKMLTYDPEKRITAAEALNDPWVVKFTAPQSKSMSKLAAGALKNLSTFNVC